MDSTRLDTQIQRIAKGLSGGNLFLAEELRSEMHIAIMPLSAMNDDAYIDTARVAAEAYLEGKGRAVKSIYPREYGDDIGALADAIIELTADIEPDGIYCPYCGWINEEPENEYEYLTYHGDEEPKPYECPECGETFMVREMVMRSWEITKRSDDG